MNLKTVQPEAFLRYVDVIAAEQPAYALGKDGTGGKCDCIGLIIGAIRRAGGEWTGVHGTNWTVRNAVEYLLPSENGLQVGEIVFKSRAKGERYYDLPSRYKDSPDQLDYYHVGVVRSVDPLRIVHCTSPGGIKEDTKRGNWAWRAWCSVIEKESEGETVANEMIVTAPSGNTVNMRASASLNAALVTRVDVGSRVTVQQKSGDWSRVTYGKYNGYIKNEYLKDPAGESAPQESTDILSALYAARDAVNEAIRQAEDMQRG